MGIRPSGEYIALVAVFVPADAMLRAAEATCGAWSALTLRIVAWMLELLGVCQLNQDWI